MYTCITDFYTSILLHPDRLPEKGPASAPGHVSLNLQKMRFVYTKRSFWACDACCTSWKTSVSCRRNAHFVCLSIFVVLESWSRAGCQKWLRKKPEMLLWRQPRNAILPTRNAHFGVRWAWMMFWKFGVGISIGSASGTGGQEGGTWRTLGVPDRRHDEQGHSWRHE